ncbi:MAG: hypothetical protein EXR76_14065 [Myxococcales bacterium]|nr:hypothetical protein [Myxococcales bacterium]
MNGVRAIATSRSLAIALLAAPTASHAADESLSTCVEVLTSRADAAQLERLVRDEVDRHPTHRTSTDQAACKSFLRIEFIDVKEGRFITARLNEQVPHRERVSGDDLPAALSKCLTIALHNDPVLLSGPGATDMFSVRGAALKQRGENLMSGEMTQTAVYVHGEVDFLPGIGLGLRREVNDWHVAVRLHVAIDPNQRGREATHARQLYSGGLEFSHFFDGRATSSMFVSGLVGLEHQRFRGPAPLLGEGVFATAHKTGTAIGGRFGFEVARISDARLSFFSQISLPLFISTRDEGGVVDQWTPTLSLGSGVAF